MLYDTYYKKDIRMLEHIEAEKINLIREAYKLLNSKKGPDNIVIYHLGEVVRLAHGSSSQLMGIIL